MRKTVIVASLLALAGMSSVAAAADDNWFARGDVGQGRISVDTLGHDNATGGAVGVGYYFNPYFAVEGNYTNFGSYHSVNVDAWGIGLVAKTHFSEVQTGFFVDGRLGVDRLQARFHNISGSTTKAYFGVGGGYDFTPNFGMSLNYMYNDGGSGTKAQLLSGGLEVRF